MKEDLISYKKLKNEWNCNPGHNILELYNILVQVGFTANKTKLKI